MQTHPDCYLCIVKQAIHAMQVSDVAETTQIVALRQIFNVLHESDPGLNPSEISSQTNQIVRETTGITDLYGAIKQENTRQALDIYPDLKILVEEASDPLDMAIRLSAAGNIIDVVHDQDYDLWGEVERAIKKPISGNGMTAFRDRILKANRLLILADNAGETVFDRVLIEALDIPVTYAVKGGPILNDATYQDAVDANIDEAATLIETGSAGPGTILSDCMPEFLEELSGADLVLAKGQANYETLSGQGFDNLFFLLRIKCPIIGLNIGHPVGEIVLEQATK